MPAPTPPSEHSARGGAIMAESSRPYHWLAAELHDGALQDIFAAELDLDEALNVAMLQGPARECVERAARRLREGASHARKLLAALEDPNNAALSHTLGLQPQGPAEDTLRDCVACFQRSSSIIIDLVSSGTGLPPGNDGVHLLLRVLQEGLANVLKHARASRASVHVERGPAQWAVQVHDDGVGDPRQLLAMLTIGSPSAFGVRSLRGDARDVGGQFWIDRSRVLGGVVIGAAAPVDCLAEQTSCPASVATASRP